MKISQLHMAAWVAGAVLLAVVPVRAAETQQSGQGQAVVTVLPEHGETVSPIAPEDMSLKIDGKSSSITQWQPLSGAAHRIEVVFLIDDGARASLGNQIPEIQKFIHELPANAAVGIAYMQNGRAVLTGPLSTDHEAALHSLRLPAGGSPGISASPYFCLSDLAKHWPSEELGARREVVLISDGVDYYEMRYDPEDPYVQAAISDALRSHIVVYAIYWRSTGWFDRTDYANDSGQNLLAQLTEATGGVNYWIGSGNPVSFRPYLADIGRRIDNQYELGYATELRGKPGVADLKLKVKHPSAKVHAPGQTFVERSNGSEK